MNQETQGIVVFGASRGVGRQVVEQALAAGVPVTAVARNGAELREAFPEARIVEGSATDPRVVDEALREGGAVICTLGAAALSNSRIRSEGTAAIIEGMKRAGLTRILALSLLGALETRKDLPFLIKHFMFPLYLRKPVADHERQERMLQASGLDWTVVRPPFLTDEEVTGSYAHGFGGDYSDLTLKISRADAAHFFLGQISSSAYLRRAVGISDRKAKLAA